MMHIQSMLECLGESRCLAKESLHCISVNLRYCHKYEV